MAANIIIIEAVELRAIEAVCLNCEPTGTLDDDMAAPELHVGEHPGHVVRVTLEAINYVTTGGIIAHGPDAIRIKADQGEVAL